jgi:lipopolysaccharide transport system permease protein
MAGLLSTAAFPSLLHLITRHRHLVILLAKRNVQGRYKGSLLGMIWALLTPVLMLFVYIFVFSVVFETRWGTNESQSRTDFGLALFAGLTAFNLFAETISISPGLILANRNYVKRIVFPLEVLPASQFLANLVQATCCFLILLVALLTVRGGIPWTVLFLPVVLLPLSLLTLGCAYFVSSLGVFIRDAQHIIGFLVTMLLFLSAVFYPVTAVPPTWQWLLRLNPLVPIIEDVRQVTLHGEPPDWPHWCLVTLFGSFTFAAGLAWFSKSKRAFADVL